MLVMCCPPTIIYDAGLFLVGVLIILLAAIALRRRYAVPAILGGFLALLMTGPYFLGTVLGVVSLAVLVLRVRTRS